MSDVIQFFVPGRCVQWHRAGEQGNMCPVCHGTKLVNAQRCPKCRGRGFSFRKFQKKEDKSYQAELKATYLATVGGSHEPPTCPLCVDVLAVYPVPLSPKKRAAAILYEWEEINQIPGMEFPLDYMNGLTLGLIGRPSYPDRDNLTKQVGDGLKQVAWADDRQIVDGREAKVYGPVPGLWVRIVKLEVPQ